MKGLPAPLPQSGDARFQVLGDLTVKGKSYPVTWDAIGHFGAGEAVMNGVLSATFDEFGLKKPSVAIVLSLEDRFQLEADLHFTVSAPPSGQG